MMEGRMPEAKESIQRAQTLANPSDASEQSHVAAFAQLLNGQPQHARQTVKSHVIDYPRDAMVA